MCRPVRVMLAAPNEAVRDRQFLFHVRPWGATMLKSGAGKFVACASVVLMGIVAQARPAHATRGDGADVVRVEGVCRISGTPIGYPGTILTAVQDIQTPNGLSNFRCAGTIPAGYAPDRA